MELLGSLIGGLGLFLLAVGMITDGLRMAAGEALRDLLGRWTRTPLHGIGAGALITGIVQSSSAVTVATIGFVNANLLSMQQALGVVYGANIGTTMTGWLVAAVGFKIKVEIFALPMIGLGMILHLTGAGRRRGAVGQALAGFGLFFIGIDVLRGAFEGLAQGVDLAGLGGNSISGLLMFVAVGIFMTVMTQSSSAAIAITLTAATGGLIAVPAAAAMVIGANVGTTSTAIFAALGATANAKRVAAAHVIFNLATGIVALLMLPGLLWMVGRTGQWLDMQGGPAVALALFHTLFNILGVLLLYPFTRRLASLLQERFVTAAENLGRPQYLDSTTAKTPLLAQDAMRLELLHVFKMNRRLAAMALQQPVDQKQFSGLQAAIGSLCDVIDTAVAQLERSRMTPAESQALPEILHIARQLRESSAAAAQAQRHMPGIAQSQELLTGIRALLATWETQGTLYDAAISDQNRTVRQSYDKARAEILEATAGGQFQPSHANQLLDDVRATRRMINQLVKVGRSLQRLSDLAPPDKQEASQAAADSPQIDKVDPLA